MRNVFAIFFLLSVLQTASYAQTSFEVIPSFGWTYTPTIPYQNCTGHFSSSFTPALSFEYHPLEALGFELNYSSLHPSTYLANPNGSSVSAYTFSIVKFQRLLTGVNYFVCFNKIHPYIGILAGFTYAETSQVYQPSSYTSFSWACQAGIDYYFLPRVGLHLNAALTNSPNIPNNTAYFNLDKNGGFPSFADINPSKANIAQWDISLGFVVRFLNSGK